MEFTGKVAIVTGSSRGIGRAYARALGAEGAQVVAVARTLKEAPKSAGGPSERQVRGGMPGSVSTTAQLITTAGGKALPLACDVSQEQQVQALVADVIKRFGKIDVLVNNAAVYPRCNYLEETPESFDTMFHINVLGYYLMMKHVLPHMIKRKSGSIVNISNGSSQMTTASRGGETGRDLLFYTMSKATINRMNSFIADEVAEYGIAVNALTPGIIKSEGMDDALGDDFDYGKDGVKILPATPEILGPPMLHLAKQTAKTCTGQIFKTPEWGKTWPK